MIRRQVTATRRDGIAANRCIYGDEATGNSRLVNPPQCVIIG